ncbi:helix-turn-helix domain-containing protein [Aliarcobacter butzleri]|uniref:helix-turn-helix domain-containing protein n=1 Tax=Aliarcobacter butzleri TaxID=28197 RepID=UPI003AF71BB2
MKRKIDINKINHLLEKSNKTPKQLAEFIKYPVTNLSLALNKKFNRTIPMDYLLSISEFFKIKPKDITFSIVENIPNNKNKKKVCEEKK